MKNAPRITVSRDGPYLVEGGLPIAHRGITARGPRSDAVHVRGDIPGLGAVALTAVDGQALVRTPG